MFKSIREHVGQPTWYHMSDVVGGGDDLREVALD